MSNAIAHDDLEIPAFLDRRKYDADGKLIRKTPEELRRLLGNGERVWVMPKGNIPVATAASVVRAPKVSVPKEPKLVKGAGGVGRAGTTAEKVREMIRAAMAANLTPESVMARARAELGMGDAQSKRYVTENWARVLKAKNG